MTIEQNWYAAWHKRMTDAAYPQNVTNQEIIDRLEAEMMKNLDAYKDRSQVVYSVTQDEILAFVRSFGILGDPKGKIVHEFDRTELARTQAEIADIEQMLASRSEEDDPVGHMQFSERLLHLQQSLKPLLEKVHGA